MKPIFVLALLGLLAAQPSIVAQDTAKPAAPQPGQPFPLAPPTQPAQPLPQFDLQFGGGPPTLLIEEIEKRTGKRLNVIVPDEYRDTLLPEFNMKGVTVPQLFEALEQASRKRVSYVTGTYFGAGGAPQSQYNSTTVSYGFKTTGPVREDSIWHFFREEPPEAPTQSVAPAQAKVCRFYQLGHYLESYKIEDITTAIETGWRMLGEKPMPDLKFHKDTQLLIAVGEPDKLRLIDSLLEQLRDGGSVPGAKPAKVKVEPAKQ